MGNSAEREALISLLPWRPPGRLDHELAAQLELIEEERQATRALNESLGAPSAAAWERIAAVIAAEPRRPSWREQWRRALTLSPERLALAGGAACLIIVLEAAALASLLAGTDGRPAAEIGGGAALTRSIRPIAAARPAAPTVMIAFAPQARMSEIEALLVGRQATIIEGPRAGRYKVRIGDKPLGEAETAALIADLSGEPLIVSARLGGP